MIRKFVVNGRTVTVEKNSKVKFHGLTFQRLEVGVPMLDHRGNLRGYRITYSYAPNRSNWEQIESQIKREFAYL